MTFPPSSVVDRTRDAIRRQHEAEIDRIVAEAQRDPRVLAEALINQGMINFKNLIVLAFAVLLFALMFGNIGKPTEPEIWGFGMITLLVFALTSAAGIVWWDGPRIDRLLARKEVAPVEEISA